MKKFSERVSSLRNRLGLSQEAFAKQLGVSRNYVSMIEQGREPSVSLKRLIETMEDGPAAPAGVIREDAASYSFTDRTQPSGLITGNASGLLHACTVMLSTLTHADSKAGFECITKGFEEIWERYKAAKMAELK